MFLKKHPLIVDVIILQARLKLGMSRVVQKIGSGPQVAHVCDRLEIPETFT